MIIKTIFASALLLGSVVVMACPGKEGECKDGQCKLKKNDIAAYLELEGDKAEKVRALQKKQKEELKALRVERVEAMSAKRTLHKSELRALLTEDEMIKVKEMLSVHRHHDTKKGGHHHPESVKPKQCKHKDKGDSHSH